MLYFNRQLNTQTPKACEILIRIWNSPTFMTWGSFFSRSMGLVVILTLILTKFSTAEISLWYLFATMISFQSLADMGFSPTFVRVIAYAMGGCDVDQLTDGVGNKNKEPNFKTIEYICSTMRVIFYRLSILYIVILTVGGSIALIRPISEVQDTSSVWIAWGIIIIASFIVMYGHIYSAYLQGVNKVATLRRWEMITFLGSIISMFVVLILNGKILYVILANQLWQIFSVFLRRWLCRNVENGRFATFTKNKINKTVFYAVWPSAWRSGIGIFTSYGLIQISGILYAQIGSVSSVASYLLSLRLIGVISDFSRAPFYSKIPLYAKLYSKGEISLLIEKVKKSMFFSYWAYVLPFIALGLFGKQLFILVGSNADFPSHLLWLLFGLCFFIERFGAMHVQLYSFTNQIIWHIANSVSGVIYILVSLILFNPIGVYAFPIGLLTGNIGFYSWYAAHHSYKFYELNFFSFEKDTIFLPSLILLFYSIYSVTVSIRYI